MNTNIATAVSSPKLSTPEFSDTGLIHLLHSNNLRAVLWKGRALETSSDIEGDIDVLIHIDDKERAESFLRDEGFHLVKNSLWRTQPHVNDWYCVANTRLIHVQLYNQLVLGSYASPQLLVPNQNVLFANSKLYSSDEESAVLRICRATLCSRFHPGKPPARLLKEARELVSETETIRTTAARLFDDETAKKIEHAYQTGDIRELKSHLLNSFKSPSPAGGIGVKAHVLKFISSTNRRVFNLPILSRRALNKPAPIIALIGSDGSGKSTAAAKSAKRIGEKIDTKFIYFGTGDGTSSLLRLPLVLLKQFRERVTKRSAKKTTSDIDTNKITSEKDVPNFAKAAWAISVALERRSKMKQAKKYAAAGIIVITDRYPQNEYPGIHDGPRLANWLSDSDVQPKSFKHKLANWEQGIYNDLASNHPDLVILLDIDLENASLRRPEELVEDLKRRIEVARELKFAHTNKVVISAIEPIHVVHDKTMSTILEAAVGEI